MPLLAPGPKTTLLPSTWWRWAALCIPYRIRTEQAVSSAQIRLGLPSLKTFPPSTPTVWVNPERQEKQGPYPCMTEDPYLNSMQLFFYTTYHDCDDCSHKPLPLRTGVCTQVCISLVLFCVVFSCLVAAGRSLVSAET